MRCLQMHPEISHVPLSSGFPLQPLPTWGNGHSRLGFGIDSLLLQPEAIDLTLGSHGWVHPETCVYPRAVLDPEMPCLGPAWGAEAHGPFCPAALCQQLSQPPGRVFLVLFKELRSLTQSLGDRGHSVKLLSLHLVFLPGSGAGLKGGGCVTTGNAKKAVR